MLSLRDSYLPALARDAIAEAVHRACGLPPPAPVRPVEPAALRPLLDSPRGVFVTLYRGGRLYGCIGALKPGNALRELLPEMAAGSALRDPRFPDRIPSVQDLDDLEIEISLLSPMFRARLPEDLRIGVHGVYISDGERSGCFLPKVAVQMGWSPEQFLAECCRGKAGLEPDAWRRPEVTVRLFTVEVVGAAE